MMSEQSRTVVVLFGGDPRREERRKGLPPRFINTIHGTLLRTLSGLDGVDVLVARDCGDEFLLGETRWQLGSLAARVETALAHGFSRGYARVVLLAGDVVDVRRDDLDRGLETLKSTAHRAVIGLSGDGGFYAAGFNQRPELDWSAVLSDPRSAGRALMDALHAVGVEVAKLPSADDIDTRQDAERLVRLRRSSRAFLHFIARLASILPSVKPFMRSEGTRFHSACARSSTLRGPPEPCRPL